MNDIVESPFATSKAVAARPASSGAMANSNRQIAEVQAMLVMARANPRDQIAATDRILNAFTRPTLAASAMYQFARGGDDIDGPSIRAAEAMAQMWGNMEFGFRELSRGIGQDGIGFSEVEAYAWDLEVLTRRPIQFIARHWRDTKRGGYALKDERDIYELMANMAQRRVRACILAIIPGDVTEAAMKQADVTLNATADTSPEAITKMLEAFAPFGVTKEQIEKRIQRRLEAMQPAQMVRLKKVYASLRDNMSTPADWFDVEGQEPTNAPTHKPPESYPQDQFDANLPKWRKLIDDGKKTADQIIAMANTKAPPTDIQKAAIHGTAAKATPATVEAIRAKATAATIGEADILKHLGIEKLDDMTVAQAERAIAFINDPVGSQQ